MIDLIAEEKKIDEITISQNEITWYLRKYLELTYLRQCFLISIDERYKDTHPG